MLLSLETSIAAPREHVFSVLSDIAGWPDQISGIDRVELLTEGPVRVGTRFRETRRMHGREATEEMTVAELVAPERLVLTAENHGTHYRASHYLEADGSSRTRLRLEFEGRPVSFLAWLCVPLATLFKGAVKRAMLADLADLKRAAEQNPSA